MKKTNPRKFNIDPGIRRPSPRESAIGTRLHLPMYKKRMPTRVNSHYPNAEPTSSVVNITGVLLEGKDDPSIEMMSENSRC